MAKDKREEDRKRREDKLNNLGIEDKEDEWTKFNGRHPKFKSA